MCAKPRCEIQIQCIFWRCVFVYDTRILGGVCIWLAGAPDRYTPRTLYTLLLTTLPAARASLPFGRRLPAARLRLQVFVVVGRGDAIAMVTWTPKLTPPARWRNQPLCTVCTVCMYVHVQAPRPQVCISCKVFRVFCVFTLKCVFVYDTCI